MARAIAEVALPSGGKKEFDVLHDRLAEAQTLLDEAGSGVAVHHGADLDAEARAVAAHGSAAAILKDIGVRAEVFEKRARETDPDRKVYGPKMIQRVLDFCANLQAAVENADELDEALEASRARIAAAEVAAADAAKAAAALAAEQEAAAAAEKAAAEELAAAAAREAAEEEARLRAAAIAAPLGGVAVLLDDDGDATMMDEMGRRPLVEGLDLCGALDLLAQSCADDAKALAGALQALQGLCVNVIARPEEASFRTIRLLNGPFQQTIARHAGGVEALLTLGFAERESLDDEEAIFYVMEEPSLEDDYERWALWYDGLKAARDELLRRMEGLGVRAVAPASKGTGWSEATAGEEPARHAQPMGGLTLHGQRGGGI